MMKEIFGLVVCGGESSRMGMDKSLLVYFNKPQRYHLFDMIKPLCDKVFISCNKIQSSTITDEYEKIVDAVKYEHIGPMASLLSAFEQYPENNFLVIACDYPFIKFEDVLQLITEMDDNHLAVSFYNAETGMKEPLIALYSHKCYPLLLQYFDKKDYSLRNFLKEIDAKKIDPSSSNVLKSIDTPEAYHEALLLLRELNGNKLTHSI